MSFDPQHLAKGEKKRIHIGFGLEVTVVSNARVKQATFGVTYFDSENNPHPAPREFVITRGDSSLETTFDSEYLMDVDFPNEAEWDMASGGGEIWVKSVLMNDGRTWADNGQHSCNKIKRAPVSNLQESYDKFKDITSFFLKPGLETKIAVGDLNSLNLNVVYACQGQVNSSSCKPSKLLLSLDSVATEWRFIKDDRTLIFIVDGRRVPLGQADWDGEVGEGRVYESMGLRLPATVLSLIARGRSVEGQIGHREFILTDAQLAALRSIPALADPTPQPATAKQKSAATRKLSSPQKTNTGIRK